MLNSINLTANNHHHPLKVKSMFDLVIASSQQQRYSPTQTQSQQPPPPHQNFPGLYNLPQHLQNFKFQQQQHSPIINDNNNSSSGAGSVTMEDYTFGSGGTYSRSPQSDISQRSHDSSLSPSGLGEGRGMSPSGYNNNNLTSTIPTVVTETGGKSTGRGSKLGITSGSSSGGKPSFSIESLLAHSGNWRQQTNNNPAGREEIKRTNRFLPYHIGSQSHHQQQQQHQNQPQPSHHSKRFNDNSNNSKSANVNNNCATTQAQADNGSSKKSDSVIGQGAGKPTSIIAGNARRVTKSKRVRTIFTPEQLERLEAEFERQQYMVGPERLYLASSLYLTEAQVKVWFQNRRIKWRKQHLEMEQQRLAIYRTLAEQDMISSMGPEEDDEEQEEDDTADCDYDLEEGDSGRGRDDDHHRSPATSPSTAAATAAAQQRGRAVIHSFPMQTHSPQFSNTTLPIQHPNINNNNVNSSNSKQTNTSAKSSTDRLRLPLQLSSTNGDFDAGPSVKTALIPPQPPPVSKE